MNAFTEIFQIKDKIHRSENSSSIDDGRRAGEKDNPYLSARRTWNDHMRGVQASRSMWQLLAILCLMITLVSIAGVIYIGSQAIPTGTQLIRWIIEMNKFNTIMKL